MKPPQGRIEIGWRVRTIDGRRGQVVGERHVPSNGAWYYTVTLEDGRREELPDHALHRLPPEDTAGGTGAPQPDPGRDP